MFTNQTGETCLHCQQPMPAGAGYARYVRGIPQGFYHLGPCPTRPAPSFELDDSDEPSCSHCMGELILLGQLGDLLHFDCRRCGLKHALPASHYYEEA